MNHLQYDVSLQEDGRMRVTETWDINVSHTNTLFRDFVDSQKRYEIDDVVVKDLDTGKSLIKTDIESYHMTTGEFYALNIDPRTFEIAWGTGMEKKQGNKKYQISYTVQNVVNDYIDCQEFYWKFLDDSNGIPCKKVTGTITLPREVSDIENLKVWGHGNIQGTIERKAKNQVAFSIENFTPNTMLEVRTVVTDKMFTVDPKYQKQYHNLENIIQEETNWAEETNQNNQQKIIIYVILGVIYLAILLYIGLKIKKYYRISKQADDGLVRRNLTYFRDIPRDGESTPGEGAYLYLFENNYQWTDNAQTDILTGTILDLCLKGYIALEEKEKEIYVSFRKESEGLKKDEEEVYDLLKKVAGNREEFAIEEMNEYAKKHYNSFSSKVIKMRQSVMKNLFDLGLIDKKKTKEYDQMQRASWYYGICVLIIGILLYLGQGWISIFAPYYVFRYGVGLIQAIPTLAVIALPLIIALWMLHITMGKCENKICKLTQEGKTEEEEWKALAKYLEECSLIEERGVFDIVIWEKYLVFATAFGISKKVVEQMEAKYPYVFTPEYWEENQELQNHPVLSFSCNPIYFHTHVGISNLAHTVHQSYQTAQYQIQIHSSSGSGGGGGFSSGGGGRRRRWPEWAEDKTKPKKKIKRYLTYEMTLYFFYLSFY